VGDREKGSLTMQAWPGGFRCGRCSEQRAMRQRALRSPLRPTLAICETCLETWERAGHRCARCWATVRDRLDVGLLVEIGAFAHVTCGGARVLGSTIAGPIDVWPGG
jgi:hypothetical protein